MGAVNTTYTFTPTDTITSTKMNNIIDETVMTSQACLAGGGLEVASGQLTIAQNAVTPSRIDSNAVTTLKIADGAVTPAKLSSGGPSWTGTGAGGVFGVPQTGLEFGTGHTQDYNCFIDLHAAATPTDFETRIVRNGGANGSFQILNQGSGTIRLSSVGGVVFDTATMFNPDGTAPIYGNRAWGVIALDTAGRTIVGAKNVTSVSRIDATHTQVTFQYPLIDTVYAVTGCARNDAVLEFATYDHQTTGFKIRHSTDTSGRFVQFMVIR